MPDQNSLINLQYQFSIVNDLNIEIKKLKEKISDNSQIIETEQLMQPVTEKFNSLSVSKRQQENILGDLETNQKKLKDKMFDGSISNAKEFSAIEDEIKQNELKISTCQDSVLAILDESDKYENALDQANQKLTKLKNDKQIQDQIDTELINKYESELAKEQVILESEIKNNDQISINLFNKIASQNSYVAVAEVHNDRCGACKILIPKSKITQIKENNDFVICDSCPVILCMKGK